MGAALRGGDFSALDEVIYDTNDPEYFDFAKVGGACRQYQNPC